jgi:hypothetical protein
MYGLAAVKSAEITWPIADDPESKPLQAKNALNEKATLRAIECR